jgi:hypothetical protein
LDLETIILIRKTSFVENELESPRLQDMRQDFNFCIESVYRLRAEMAAAKVIGVGASFEG